MTAFLDANATKQCSKCKEVKPISNFYRSKKSTTGYRSDCTVCHLAYFKRMGQAKRQYREKLITEHIASGVKQCFVCSEIKPFEDFHKRSNSLDGTDHRCKQCRRKHDHERYKANPRDPAVAREIYVKTRYHLKFDVYEYLFPKQGGLCAACGKPETIIDPRTKEIRRLAIDHDHKTDEVRGLLCQACNISLGLLQDDPARIRALLAYAELWSGHD